MISMTETIDATYTASKLYKGKCSTGWSPVVIVIESDPENWLTNSNSNNSDNTKIVAIFIHTWVEKDVFLRHGRFQS